MMRFPNILLTALTAALLLSGCNAVQTPQTQSPAQQQAGKTATPASMEFAKAIQGMDKIQAKVTHIQDGDTITVSPLEGADKGKSITVRELLLDTPESVKPGMKQPMKVAKTASDYNKKMLTDRTVTLVFDKGSSKKDRYGRYLAYVYLDGKCVEAEMIRQGYGIVRYVYSGTDTLYPQFKEVEAEAKGAGKGVWDIPGYVVQGKGKEQHYNMDKAY